MREITWSVKGTPNVLVQSLPYWTSKSWAHSLIYGHFQQHSYGYLRTYAVNLDTAVRFDPVRVQNFGDLATFTVDFCILYAECPPCFYFQFAWPTDLESIPHASTPTSIIPTKFEAPAPIYSWVMSYNVSRWLGLPLKMRTLLLRMRRITWPVSRGLKATTFLESPTPICLFTIQLFWGYDDD